MASNNASTSCVHFLHLLQDETGLRPVARVAAVARAQASRGINGIHKRYLWQEARSFLSANARASHSSLL